jgi:hypothetical protein
MPDVWADPTAIGPNIVLFLLGVIRVFNEPYSLYDDPTFADFGSINGGMVNTKGIPVISETGLVVASVSTGTADAIQSPGFDREPCTPAMKGITLGIRDDMGVITPDGLLDFGAMGGMLARAIRNSRDSAAMALSGSLAVSTGSPTVNMNLSAFLAGTYLLENGQPGGGRFVWHAPAKQITDLKSSVVSVAATAISNMQATGQFAAANANQIQEYMGVQIIRKDTGYSSSGGGNQGIMYTQGTGITPFGRIYGNAPQTAIQRGATPFMPGAWTEIDFSGAAKRQSVMVGTTYHGVCEIGALNSGGYCRAIRTDGKAT